MRFCPVQPFLWLVACAGLPLCLAGCGAEAAPTAPQTKTIVRVATPVARDVTDYVYFTGRTEAVQSVDVKARVTGYLKSIDFTAGTEVTADERLFKIDPRPYQAVLDEADSQVKLAEARLKLAEADYQRALEVAKTPGAISQQDVDRYAAALGESQASIAAAQANSESARLNLEFTDVQSPIDGLVGRELLTVGNLVEQDRTLLTTVVSQDPIYAYFDVDEQTMLRLERLVHEGKLRRVNEGDKIAVQLGLADEGNDYPHEGHVDFVNNQLDPSTGTIQVRGEFPNPALNSRGARLLKPGLFVRIRLPIGEPYQALLVPQSAVGTDQGRRYLYVVNEQNVVEYRPVTLGPQQPDGLQVVVPVKMVRTETGLRVADAANDTDDQTVASLLPDDRIVVSGLQRARPGLTVEPRPMEDNAAATHSAAPAQADKPSQPEAPATKSSPSE